MEKKIKMSAADALETYEMLRASHTLLRMAFGAIAMSFNDDEKKAKTLSKSFDVVFNQIRDAASFYVNLSEQAKAEKPADKSAN